MKSFLSLIVALAFVQTACASLAKKRVDPVEIEKLLKTTGVVGWVHGSVADRSLYVFTYRNPTDFFDNAQFPMIADSPVVLEALKKLQRHDQVRLKGEFIASPAPIKHIWVKEVTVEKSWDGDRGVEPYHYVADIPAELQGRTELIGRVHAVDAQGKVLVIEYKDAVIPVFMRDPSLSKDLYRGDKIRLHYVIRQHPPEPTHLSPSRADGPAIEVLQRVLDGHGKPITVEGSLVLFEKSPQITLDIYALQSIDAEGVALEYTLVNFDDPAVFQRIREKLKAAWDAQAATATNGRNKLINKKIRVKAIGVLNVQSPAQANPQILLTGPEKIELN